MSQPYFKEILDLAPKVAAKEASRQRDEAEASRRASQEQAEAEAANAELERKALERGEQINLLLNTNPNLPPDMPLYASVQVGLAEPRDHVDPITDEATKVRDPLYMYQHKDDLRPLFAYGKRGEQLSISRSGQLYTGVGQSPDMYHRKINGRTRRAEPGAEGAYDLRPLAPEEALSLMDQDLFKESLAGLLIQTDGFSDQITDKRADERRYAQQTKDSAAAERAEARAAIEARRKRASVRRGELATQASLIDQVVDSLHLEPRIDAAIGSAVEAGNVRTTIGLAGVHDNKRAVKMCNNNCDEDRAVQAKLNQLASERVGWQLKLLAPAGGKPERLILIQRQN